MAALSQKCQYALRAVLELSKHFGGKPVPVSEIAKAQAIPRRFLELIIKELKQGEVVKAHRGAHGGYTLTIAPDTLAIGAIIRLMGGPVRSVDCVECGGDRPCTRVNICDFAAFWRVVNEMLAQIYDSTTFHDLLTGALPVPAFEPASPPSTTPSR